MISTPHCPRQTRFSTVAIMAIVIVLTAAIPVNPSVAESPNGGMGGATGDESPPAAAPAAFWAKFLEFLWHASEYFIGSAGGDSCITHFDIISFYINDFGTIYVGETRDVILVFQAKSCGETGPYDIDLQVLDGENWVTREEATIGTYSLNGAQTPTLAMSLQMTDTGTFDLRARISDTAGYESYNTTPVTITVDNPITYWFDPSSRTVEHSPFNGLEQDLVISNASTEPFVLNFVVFADQYWDTGAGVIEGGDILAFTACVSHDCTAAHTEKMWGEYFNFNGHLNLGDGRYWNYSLGGMCKMNTCCGTSIPPVCTPDADPTAVCTWDPEGGVCGEPTPTTQAVVLVGPVIDPTVNVPLPFSFVVHSPPEIIPPGLEFWPPSVPADSPLVGDLVELARHRPVPGLSVTVNTVAPTNPSTSSGSCVEGCAEFACEYEMTIQDPTSATNSTNQDGIAAFPGSFVLGEKIHVSLEETDFYHERELQCTARDVVDDQQPIWVWPKLAKRLQGTLTLPNGLPATGEVYVEATPEISTLIQNLSVDELQQLGVPVNDPKIILHLDRVLIPLGGVNDGTFDIPNYPMRLLGWPTANLVFRARYATVNETRSLEKTVPIVLGVADDAFDAIQVGDIQFAPVEMGVPTVSTWGMVVMLLLVLAAGTIVMRNRGAYSPV